MIIYKYVVWNNNRLINPIRFELPKLDGLIDIHLQDSIICTWFMLHEKEIEDGVKLHMTNIGIFGTGHEFSGFKKEDHKKTFRDGSFVWHVFMSQ